MKDNTIISYLYVLDFCDCTLNEIPITKEDEDIDTDILLRKYGCKIDNCNFMYSNRKLELITLTKVH